MNVLTKEWEKNYGFWRRKTENIFHLLMCDALKSIFYLLRWGFTTKSIASNNDGTLERKIVWWWWWWWEVKGKISNSTCQRSIKFNNLTFNERIRKKICHLWRFSHIRVLWIFHTKHVTWCLESRVFYITFKKLFFSQFFS